MIYYVPDDDDVKDFMARVGQHEALASFTLRSLADESAFNDKFDEEGEEVYAAVMFTSLNETVSACDPKGLSKLKCSLSCQNFNQMNDH